MNRTERLLRILNHLPVDRIPVTGFLVSITKELMEAVDVKLPEAHHDPARMVKLAAAAHDLLGLESMKLPFDMTVEAGSVGAEIDYGSMTSLPQVKKHPYEDPEELLLKEGWMDRKGVRVQGAFFYGILLLTFPPSFDRKLSRQEALRLNTVRNASRVLNP